MVVNRVSMVDAARDVDMCFTHASTWDFRIFPRGTSLKVQFLTAWAALAGVESTQIWRGDQSS